MLFGIGDLEQGRAARAAEVYSELGLMGRQWASLTPP